MSALPDDLRSLTLSYDGICVVCGITLARSTAARYSPSTKAVVCEPCAGGASFALANAGTAGAGAAREHERRKAKDDAAIERSWGRLAPIAKRFSEPKQSTNAWARGAVGEERLAAFLERELAGEAILIHDRSIPGSKANIDHIAVAPSGVWVIDAKRYAGRVEKRDVGDWFRTDVRVYVNGRDRTNLLHAMPQQVEVVRAALREVPEFAEIPVRAAVCFTDSDWGVLNLGKPFAIDGVLVTYPGALRKTLSEPAALTADEVGRVAARLASALPAAYPSP